ncbi:MAG: hypothetical protein WCS73_10780 [Lentisphaeria bacterium]
MNFDFIPGRFSNFDWRVIPDDCVDGIMINGISIPVDTLSGRCDYTKGFRVNANELSALQALPIAHVTFEMHNGGGPGGVSMEVEPTGWAWGFLVICLSAILLALFFCILRRVHLPLPFALLILLACALHLVYTLHTPYSARTHDVDGHIAYVKYIAENHTLPPANECWSCYQPPVYYVMSAPVWSAAASFGYSSPRALQWLSFLLSFVLLAAGTCCLRSVLKGPALWLSFLLWIFWPVGFLIAPRVGNDQLFFVAHVICLWGALAYILGKGGKYLIVGALACWLAFWTKSTGAITIGIFFFALFLGYFPREKWKPTVSELVAILFSVGLCITIFIVKFVMDSDLVGNANSLNGALKVGAAPFNMFYFDAKDFFTTTYTSAWNDHGGRQFLVNYLMKTSLFGEFHLTETLLGEWCASLLCFTLAGLSFFAVVGFWIKRTSKVTVLLIVQFLLFVLAEIALRIKYPFSCSSDFRYIVPALLSFIPFVGWGIFKENASLKWKWTGILCTAVFCLATVILYLSIQR